MGPVMMMALWLGDSFATRLLVISVFLMVVVAAGKEDIHRLSIYKEKSSRGRIVLQVAGRTRRNNTSPDHQERTFAWDRVLVRKG